MKPIHSIRLRVQVIVSLLVVALVAICSIAAASAYQRREQALRVVAITGVTRDLFAAMNAIRLERGATDGLIANPGLPTPDALAYQDGLRAATDAALGKAMPKLAAVAPDGDQFGQVEVRQRLAHMMALRHSADVAIMQPPERRPPGLGAEWLAQVTGLTDAMSETTERMDAEIGRTDPFINSMMVIGQLAWSTRSAAGSDSLLWGRDTIINKPLTPEQRDQFNVLQGQVDALWARLAATAAHNRAPDSVVAAIAKAKDLYFRRDRAMRSQILNALIAGRPSPVSPAAQRVGNGEALQSLMDVANSAFGEAALRAEAEADTARDEFYLALALMLAAIGLGVAANLFVGAQVLRPIGRITQAMRAVADGDLAQEVPDVERRDEVGELARALSVFRANAEAKKRSDEALLESRIAREAAEASTRAKAEFLANMSHEIRTPLTSVIGFAGLMNKMRDLPEKAQTYTQRIITGGRLLQALVDDILDFSRIEAGKVELEPHPLEPAAFLADTIELVRQEAQGKGLVLELRGADSLPPEVLVDPKRLRQVLLNLLGNAIKFTTEGSVVVEASYQPAAGELRLKVIDTGVGVPAEQYDRLFQRFSQLDASNTRRFGGVGLGLAISKGLVELMGGEIGVEAPPAGAAGGSVFWFTLKAPMTSLALAPAEPALQPVDLGALRILVVDDVTNNRELVGDLLAPYRLSVSEASNGAEAVAAAEREPYDLILMDLQMPVMDGLAAAKAIRQGSRHNASTPILAVSANVMPRQVEACAEAGMNDHIAKPINPAELVSKIAQWAAREGAAA